MNTPAGKKGSPNFIISFKIFDFIRDIFIRLIMIGSDRIKIIPETIKLDSNTPSIPSSHLIKNIKFIHVVFSSIE